MKFIRYFFMYWAEFPIFQEFWKSKPKAVYEMIQNGEDVSYLKKNRFQYAFDLARIQWKYRDRYSRKCTGNCEACRLKHC